MGHPIQLLKLSQQRFSIEMNEILETIEKIGDMNVAIVSINGNKRTGKSFLLNYFLRFLIYGKTNIEEWVHGINETVLQGFDWRGGAERHTVGIWMWSEPYIIKDKYGKDIALLLLDTQGNFDEHTTFQECCVVFSISLLLSSTLILNIKSDISEDKLQFIEFFTYFAEEFSEETNTSAEITQRLVFLVRDWQNQHSYPFGYHDESTPVEKNFNSNVIKPTNNLSKEAINTRTKILSYFNHVNSFLMPHPGIKVFDEEFRGEKDLINSKFLENVSKFVPLILSREKIETKIINGQQLNGKSLKTYLSKLSSIIKTRKFPEAKSITAATEEVRYSFALKHAIYLFETQIRAFVEINPTEEQLCSYKKIVKVECMKFSLNEPKGNISDESKAEKIEELKNRIELIFQVYQANNLTRIEREILEDKLNLAIDKQKDMRIKLEKQQKEIYIILYDMKKDPSNKAKVKEFKLKMHSMEENTKIMEQNLEYLQQITESHDKYVNKKIERVNENKNIQEWISKYENYFQEIGSINEGKYSTVFIAKSKAEKKFYAIKKIPINENQVTQTRKEIVNLLFLSSEFIVKYSDFWIERNYYMDKKNLKHSHDSLFFATEKPLLLHFKMQMSLCSLDDVLKCFNKLEKNSINIENFKIASEIISQLLDCVNYLHENNIIHRNLKPSNILLMSGDYKRCLKLCDFGLSENYKFTEQSRFNCRNIKVYRAPELSVGHYNSKADIYSLGLILKELFCLNINDININTKERNDNFLNIYDICVRCLDPTPKNRPTCHEILSEKKSWACFEPLNLFECLKMIDISFLEEYNFMNRCDSKLSITRSKSDNETLVLDISESFAAKKNSATVLKALNYYENAIEKQFVNIQIIDKDVLLKRRIDFETEATNIFVRECVYGSEADRERFKHKFAQKMNDMKAKFMQKIKDNENQILEHTINLIKTSVSHYDNLMKQYFRITLEEKWLKKLHEITLKDSLNMFTENCINKEKMESDRNDLKEKLKNIFNEYLTNLIENIETTEKQYAKEVLKSVESYTIDMEKKMYDNQFIDDEEFFKIGKHVSDRVTIEFESKKWQKTANFSYYVTELSKMLSEEYNRLFIIKMVTKKNSAAVFLAINYFESSTEKTFEKLQSIARDELIKRRIDIEKEATNIFVRECVYGSEADRERFEHEFAQKLYEMNTKFEQKVDENERLVLEHTLKLIKTSVEHYDNKLKQYLEITLEEKGVKKLHEITLKESINMFTENSINKEKRFIETYRNDLKEKLEISFSKILGKLRENVDGIEKQYAKELRTAKERYTKDMEKIMYDNQFIGDEEFSKMDKQISDCVTNEFKNKEWQETSKLSEYVTQLSKILSEEYIRLFGINAKNREIAHSEAVKNCRVVSEKYEDVMFEEIKKISENEFEELHKIHKQSAINELKDRNPFKSEQLIDSYLIQLEENIEKSVVELKGMLSEHIARTNAENKILVRDVNVFYKQEMNKYYENTCYLSQDILKRFHIKTLEHSLSEFASRRQQNCSIQQFRAIIEFTIESTFKAILEENSKNTPTIPAIGIDLGTTNTAIAYYKPGTPFGKEIILQNDGKNTTPSVLAFTPDSDLVGHSAKEFMFTDPRKTVYSVKRLIGRYFSDESVQNDMKNLPYRISVDKNNRPLINVNTRNGPKTYSPEELSAKVLSEMKRVAEQHFRIPIKNAVITVPAYFSDSQKQATKDAAKIAGLNVLEILPEPIAAALAFKLINIDIEKRNVLVYDLGGGTFDVAVLVMEGLNIKLKSLNGDNHLGGDDFDFNLRSHCINEFYEKTNLRVTQNSDKGANSYHRLKSECERKKKLLSFSNSETIVIDNFFNNKDLRIEVTRKTFERINSDLFEKTMKLLKDTLVSAYMSESDIDDVILVGGSTRIPKIRQMLSDIFPNKQLNYTVNADEAVALGAAVQAAVLNGIKAQELGHLKISKIAPMSLGIELLDKTFSKIIRKNSRIPIKVTKNYYTAYDNQKGVEINVYEGEHEIANKNNELGRFVLSNIPPEKRAERPIEVTFDIKDDGILSVHAVSRNSNNPHEISIVRQSGSLTDEELYRLIEREMNEQK